MKSTAVIYILSSLFLTSCVGLSGERLQSQTPQIQTPQIQTSKNQTSKLYFSQNLNGFQYPYPVYHFTVKAQGQDVKMAYMDVAPARPGKDKVVVLLHGKNFSGFYFQSISKEFLKQGYRVIVPDQVGFGKSTKPKDFQFSFHQLSHLTQQLLQSLNIKSYYLVGHSMGGMLATRMALLYPLNIKKLVLINPIGLEDYKLLTHYKSIDELYELELTNNGKKIRQYQKEFYYAGQWSEEYEKLVQPAIGWVNGPDKKLMAKIAAQTTEMLYTQPVVYEFKNLVVPVVLLNGQRDKTSPGKLWALPGKADKMGDYPKLGKKIAKEIPTAKLIELPGLGHMPFIEDFEVFKKVFFTEFPKAAP